jgi:Fe-S-cluster-containing dehydrogenase component
LCVDKIYNENLPEEDRVPACVSTCPASARHFGDLGDPDSAVSKLVVERSGYDLMPELGYKPTNKYLPPREHKASPTGCGAIASPSSPTVIDADIANPFLRWVDRALSR